MQRISFEEGNIKSIELPLVSEMEKAIAHFDKELATIRTGKAQTSMIDNIKVECYGGSLMNLRDIASINVPNSQMLSVQPWDKGVIQDIDKALKSANLGLTPIIDGDLIRIEIPRMSAERRAELGKVVAKKIEDAKIQIRNIRKDVQNFIRDAEKAKTISEDFAKRLNKALQDITDKYTAKIDTLGDKKVTDLKSV